MVAILGRTDRAGGWVDPPDAPAAAPLPLDVVTDWTRPVPPREWTIGEWIPKGRIGIVAGRARDGEVAPDGPGGNAVGDRAWYATVAHGDPGCATVGRDPEEDADADCLV